MSYGTTKVSPAISILQLGVGYETGTQKVAGILNPISFNFGGLLPKGIIDNSYIGPSFQMDTAGHIYGGANISVGF